jgi:hypothetical protein
VKPSILKTPREHAQLAEYHRDRALTLNIYAKEIAITDPLASAAVKRLAKMEATRAIYQTAKLLEAIGLAAKLDI